jgi:hypothetical protein
MADIIEPPVAGPTAAPPSPKRAVKDLILFWTRELVAVSFWIYVICKLFIFDIDVYLILRIDSRLIWIAEYKFFLLIAIASIILLLTKNKSIVLWLLYIAFYPVLLFFWKIPYLIFKQRSWTLAFVFVSAIISLLRSLRYKFVAGTVFILATFFAVTFSNWTVLVVSIVVILAVLFLSYARMSIFVFQPSSIFHLYSKFIKASPDRVFTTLQDKDIRNLPVERLNDSQLELRRTSIQTLVVWNRALLFFSRKLRDYQESNLNAVAYSLNLLLLIGFTIVSYGVVNYAIFKLDSSQFSITTEPSFFIFLYYSFHVFIFGSIGEVTPAAFYSRIASMSEQSLAIVLLFILISLFISVKSERYKQELTRTIEDAEETGRVLESRIQEMYRLTLAQALEEIRKMRSNLMTLILWLSQDLE